MRRRVVITGLGTVNPLAGDLAGYWAGLCAGKSGVGLIEQFDTSKHKVKFAGAIVLFVVSTAVTYLLSLRVFQPDRP